MSDSDSNTRENLKSASGTEAAAAGIVKPFRPRQKISARPAYLTTAARVACRAQWRAATWAISCAITAPGSASLPADRIKPALMNRNPPGRVNEFTSSESKILNVNGLFQRVDVDAIATVAIPDFVGVVPLVFGQRAGCQEYRGENRVGSRSGNSRAHGNPSKPRNAAELTFTLLSTLGRSRRRVIQVETRSMPRI